MLGFYLQERMQVAVWAAEELIAPNILFEAIANSNFTSEYELLHEF